MWMTRELVFELITGNPHYKQEDKPRRKSDIIKLSTDKEDKVKEEIPRVTEQDIKTFEAIKHELGK